jgi:hypothetical protein
MFGNGVDADVRRQLTCLIRNGPRVSIRLLTSKRVQAPNHLRRETGNCFLKSRTNSALTCLRLTSLSMPRASNAVTINISMTETNITGRINNVAFMHIAKTAGSAVIDWFERAYGKSNCYPFCEHALLGGSSLHDLLLKNRFVSGHFFYGHIADLPPDQFVTFTLFRQPYSHFASHMQWLDHYNHDSYKLEFESLGEGLQELIRQIRDTNILRESDLRYFLRNLDETGTYYLNNLQTRYLIGDSEFKDPITLSDARFAETHLDGFSVIGDDTCISRALRVVGILAGSPSSAGVRAYAEVQMVNKSRAGRRIDVSNPSIQEIVRPIVESDLYIYEKIKNHESYVTNLTI